MTDVTERVFTSTELAEAAGITYRQADHWTRHGHLHADPPAPGSGFARTYTETEVQVASLIRRLTEAGFTFDTATGRARAIHAHGWTVIQQPGLTITIQHTGNDT
jgi:hypothetical protein